MSVQIESQQDQRSVLLTCQTCDVTVPVPTVSATFVAEVQAFFDAHSGCKHSVDLSA